MEKVSFRHGAFAGSDRMETTRDVERTVQACASRPRRSSSVRLQGEPGNTRNTWPEWGDIVLSKGVRRFGRAIAIGLRGTIVAGLVLGVTAMTAVPAFANSKYSGIVVDAKTGRTLYDYKADVRRYPASLTKIMTLYLLFEEIEAGRMSMQTPLKVSRYAASRPPSKLGLKPGSTIRAKDAILALVTKSANDVAVVVAENVSGSVPKFAKRMTRTARALGMKRTTFRNPSGLPDKAQVTTARDMATLGRAIKQRFPKYFKLFSTRSFKYKGRRYGNHNRLLGRVRGVDGIKTGYTRASGFNLVTNVETGGRHIVAVVMGGRTGASRNKQMTKLIGRYLPKASKGRYTAPSLVANVTTPGRPLALCRPVCEGRAGSGAEAGRDDPGRRRIDPGSAAAQAERRARDRDRLHHPRPAEARPSGRPASQDDGLRRDVPGSHAARTGTGDPQGSHRGDPGRVRKYRV